MKKKHFVDRGGLISTINLLQPTNGNGFVKQTALDYV